VKVVVRVDASLRIGTGHVMRCLTLANALRQQGTEVTFICREHEGNLIERIEQQGFQVYKLAQNTELNTEIDSSEREQLYGTQWLGTTQQQDAEQCEPILDEIQPDWLIVDHYAIDQTWQALLKENYKKLMVVDDLADRQYQCDILLDQTYGRKEEDYLGLVPKNCQMLLGSQYALLRPEFAEWRDYSLKRRASPELKKLLITMGGVDPDNITGQVLEALKNCDLPEALEIIVVMGETAPNIDAVKTKAKEMPYITQVKTNVINMAELMANADLAIGAAGATTWERCCLGLPSIQVVIADNQKEIANNLQEINAIKVLDNMSNLSKNIDSLEQKLSVYSMSASKVVNGLGVESAVKRLYA
jgi:UDP-2,4-diacetamido-2,4,6-trideoxy-beta-L-altropyranose hydrolase